MTDKLTSLSAAELKQFMADKFPELAELSGDQPPVPGQRKIAVGILSYDAKMFCKYAMCLTQAIFELAKEGFGFSYVLREGDSMVARGRNILLSKFLEAEELKDSTDLVFVDTDLEFSAADFVKLCKAPVDVIGGAYPYKDESGNFPLRWPAEGLFEENGLWSVASVTPGFFRVSRRALEMMAQEFAHLQFNDKAMGDKRAWMLFDNLMRPNGVWDEGYVFCERWRQCGGKVWLDPTFNLTHIGLKLYNHGTIAQWLDKKAETFTHLEAEFPNIPPLKLMRKTMGEDVDLTKPDEPEHDNNNVASGEAA